MKTKSTAQIHRDIDRTYNLTSPDDMIRYVARVRFAWPGGYELALAYPDGQVVCQACTRANYRQAIEDVKDGYESPFAIIVGCNYDPKEVYCDDCNKDLSSYAEMD